MDDWFPEASESQGISPTCAHNVLKTFEHIVTGTPWALQMLDSSSKLPIGIMKGNVLSMGNYYECLQVDVKEEWGSFIGRHCMAMVALPTRLLPIGKFMENMEMPQAIPLVFSMCVPSTCTAADLQYAVSWTGNYTIVNPTLCHTREVPPLEPKEWTAIIILSFIGIVCLLSTIYDLLHKEKGKRNEIVVAFSWYSNFKALFSTKVGPDAICVLNGLRFWSILFVVIGHAAVLGKVQPSINYADYMERIRKWQSLFIANAPYAVDTFFVISGLVLSYIFLKTMDTYRRFNLPIFYLHRLIRVLPVLATIVMINSTILRRFGDGPLWDFMISVTESKYCADYWWSTLLFIQNYVNTQKNCIMTSWFLAVDMQLYWISPIFLLAFYKRPRLGLILVACATIMGMIISFVEAYINKDTPNNARPTSRFDSRYYYTHTRYVTWLIGLTGGYVWYKTQGWRKEVKAGIVKLSKNIVIAGWMTFAVLFCILLYALYPFEQIDYVYSPVEGGLYFALTRPLWALCILWFIFACETGYGGILNSVFTWPGFFPLGRLTFCIYIIHFDVLIAIIYSAKLPTYNSTFTKATEVTMVLYLSILISIILSLSVEAPFIALLRILQKNPNLQSGHKAANLATVPTETEKNKNP